VFIEKLFVRKVEKSDEYIAAKTLVSASSSTVNTYTSLSR
jgi:hypothetical protein